METIVLAYICAGIALVFAFYISYLFIYKDIKFKNFILLICLWGAYTHSPLLSAIDMSGMSEIKAYEAIIFYLLTILTVVMGYAVAYVLYKILPPPLAPPSRGGEPLYAFNAPLEGAGQRRHDDGLRGLRYLKLMTIMTLGEYLRGIALSILFLGANSSIGVSDSTFSIANALALTPLSRLAYFGHIYYLTFILFLIIVVIFETHSRYKISTLNFEIISKLKYKELLTIAKPLILLFVFMGLQLIYIKYVYYKYHERQRALSGHNTSKVKSFSLNQKDIEEDTISDKDWPLINILLIPSDIPMHYDMKNIAASTTFNKFNNDYQNKLDKIIKNINSTTSSKVNLPYIKKKKEEIKYDIVILPENVAYIASLKTGKDLYKGVPILNGLLNSKEKNIISDENVTSSNNIKFNKDLTNKNSSIYIDNINNASIYRDKAYLFPFYEYKPYIANIIPDFIYKKGEDNTKKEITKGGGVMDFYLYIKRYRSDTYGFESIYKWTTIICSEFYSYDYLRSLKAHDYDFIISQSSLGIFNHSHWMQANILLGQIINSNYLAVPIINISNSASSYLIINNKIRYYYEDYMPFNINMADVDKNINK